MSTSGLAGGGDNGSASATVGGRLLGNGASRPARCCMLSAERSSGSGTRLSRCRLEAEVCEMDGHNEANTHGMPCHGSQHDCNFRLHDMPSRTTCTAMQHGMQLHAKGA